MAQFGFSIVGLIKAIEDLTNLKNSVGTVSENRYIVSTDAEAAPYGKYVEEGTSFMEARRYMRRAKKSTLLEFPTLISAIDENFSYFDDDDMGDAFMKMVATHAMHKAKKFAPVDTGELAYGVEGKGIHIIEKKQDE